MAKINVVPSVKSYRDYNKRIEFNKLNCHGCLSLYHESLLKRHLCKRTKNELKFVVDDTLSDEGYKIVVDEASVTCYYKTSAGKHNAVVTLRQLLDNKENLTTCEIVDEPNFKVRSIMIDISRNKVPSVKTLKFIIDQLALVKINDLQLYVEGRSFYFESLSEYYDNPNDFLTGEDVLELTKYASERSIQLTPNLNCFGHMGYWLNQKELNHLALSPKGFNWPWSKARNYAQTINPFDKDAKKLIYTIIDDMLKYYPDSIRCNIGGDEPFELLAPTPHPNAKEIYENHLKEVIEYVNMKNKQVYMWGDVVREYPLMLESFKDVVLLDWCYEADQITEERMSFYDEYKVPFIVCPGVGAWSSFSGKMDNMFKNIDYYAKLGRRHGALGMILTDWNDGGSMSQLVTTILAYIYGACYEWNDSDVDFDIINKYIDNNIYHNDISQKVIDLGNYYLLQDKTEGCYSKLFNTFYSYHMDGLNFDIKSYSDCAAMHTQMEILNMDECQRIKKYLYEWKKDLIYIKENDFTKELDFIYRLITHALELNILTLNLRDFNAGKEEVETLLSDVKILMKEYPKIWDKRNKLSDFKYSNYRFKLLEMKYENLIRIFNSIEKL